MNKKTTMTYSQAVEELDAIFKELENSEIVDMDKITAQVKRATVLMEYCKKQLHDIDEELQKMVEKIG
jgi:exodeoxyribonuclease VII small subunit